MEKSPQPANYLNGEDIKGIDHFIKKDMDKNDKGQDWVEVDVESRIPSLEGYLAKQLAFLDFLEDWQPTEAESEAIIQDWPEAA